MKREWEERLKDFGELVSVIVFEGLSLLVVGALMVGLQFILEYWIFHCKLENLKNYFYLVIYALGKVLLTFYIIMYMVRGFVRQLKKLFP